MLTQCNSIKNLVFITLILLVQWKPVKVTPLKVNNRLRSTVDVGPVFYALYISNIKPDNVNHHRPQSC